MVAVPVIVPVVVLELELVVSCERANESIEQSTVEDSVVQYKKSIKLALVCLLRKLR